jgi:lipid A ethanolaminephosphotransferase
MPLKLLRPTVRDPSAPDTATSPSTTPAGLHSTWMVLIVSLWLASVCNIALWRQLAQLPELGNLRGVLFGVGFGVLISLILVALMSLLAWRWTLKPLLMLLLVSAAAGAYFMMTYGIVIDGTMMVNVLQTDPRETRDLLSWRLLATLGVLGVLPAVWVWRTPVRRLGAGRQVLGNVLTFIVAVALMAGTVMAIFQDFSSVMRNHTQVRYLINPLNSLYALGTVAAKPFQRDNSRIVPIGEDARLPALAANPGKPPLLVLVLGETARMGNFGLNGYARPTTPELAKENIVSQRNAWSCGTNTAASVPCMFSHLPRGDFEDRRVNYESLLDVLQHAGLAVLWINNQSGCKGVCDRTPHVTTADLKVPGLCENGECFDEIMLRDLDQRIAALPAERRARGVVVVMHQMGSHGPAYYKRSPKAFKKFLPECTSNALQECGQAQVVNAYDNTILYTDHFLGQTLQWLKATGKTSAPALIYLSDHGESLGENNLYLHGLPYRMAPDVQKHVPWITWLSPEFEQFSGITTACLKQQADAPVSHDNYFHSVLGVLGVQTSVYQKALDIYAGCRSR